MTATRRKTSPPSIRKRRSFRKQTGGAETVSISSVPSSNASLSSADSSLVSYQDTYKNQASPDVNTTHNPIHATTYVIKYTKLSDGTIINKEVFIQGVSSYKHYMIATDDDNDGEMEETTHKCYQPIPFERFGNYLNQQYDSTKCGMELQPLGDSTT